MPLTVTLQAFRPVIEVGAQSQAALSANLLRMSVLENVSGLHRCEAVFKNWGTVGLGRSATTGFLYFDRALLDFGKHVVVKFPANAIMDGAITAIGANYPAGSSPELTVVVEDRFRDLRLVPRSRTFQNASDSDIMHQVAGDYGLSTSVDLHGPTYEVVAQLNQTDLAFLRMRARLCDAELWLQGQQLNVKSRANSGTEVVQLNLGGSLTDFTVVADTASQPTSVNATAWDVASKSATTATVTDSILGAQLRGGSSGAKAVARAFGQRPVTIPLPPIDRHVQAESTFRTHAQRFVVGHGTTAANAGIAAGAMIRLTGLGPLFTGLYYVSEVNHSFDQQTGAITRFTVESPALGQTQ